MPVAHEGEAHSPIRRAMAERLRDQADAALIGFSETFAAAIQKPLNNYEVFDINELALGPATARLISNICGFELLHSGDGLSPSQMLDSLLGLRRRKLINIEIDNLLSRAKLGSKVHDVELNLALAVLGFDTLHAALSINLLSVLRKTERLRLDQKNWPKEIEETGSPFIERTALISSSIGGIEIKQGQNLRLFLDDAGPDMKHSVELFFGKGAHACIGRSISQRSWNLISQILRQYSCFLSVESVTYRSPDFMFRFPVKVMVKASHV